MGFFVAEALSIEDYKVSPTNAYVTIRASFTHNKAGYGSAVGMPGFGGPGLPANNGYTLSCRYYVYAAKDATKPLKEDYFQMQLEAVPANPIQALYSALAADKFANKTITNDL
jgi:hypothetical protein